MERFKEWGQRQALVWHDQTFTYHWLGNAIQQWCHRLAAMDCSPEKVVAICGDHAPEVCALLLALGEARNVAVPISGVVKDRCEGLLRIAQAQAVFRFNAQDGWRMERRQVQVDHPLLKDLQRSGEAGLILFTSGSTGEPRASVHGLNRLLRRFESPGHCLRTLAFLRLDHIGGLNTLFYTLAHGGTLIATEERSPEAVCRAIERHRVELLPTSPTFLQMLLISEEYKRFDLTSLRLISYGTEPMPPCTLERLVALFPQVRFLQTYGLSEVGILRSRSKDSSSLWMKLSGDGTETKVVNGVLWVRSESAMLGYLNAPSPFDADGWFNTQDVVEEEGGYLHILGRESMLINVGGEKVHPSEVESVLLQMENVRDVVVFGEKNPILGHIVVARVVLSEPEGLDLLKKRMHAHCKDKLERHKIPARVEITPEIPMGPRLKRERPPIG